MQLLFFLRPLSHIVRQNRLFLKEASMEPTVKINFDLIPEAIRRRLISEFAYNFDRFWADPANEAEFQAWRRERAQAST